MGTIWSFLLKLYQGLSMWSLPLDLFGFLTAWQPQGNQTTYLAAEVVKNEDFGAGDIAQC